ncbi:hypothetical protein [Macrococcus lamae]|uniref:Uncharacterized protein n=1 Tax=Macrococcus lamae TaxID=198484 RepID=A0A4R6BU18_9STAP|nr:hypothetical protein [Macrococcus lamae]TDM10602.1 hypothetical protein ERX29_06030 [Macrococcus lamae]
MKSQNILISILPNKIKTEVINCNIELFAYFMENNIKDLDYAFIISNYANDINSSDAHEMAGSIFHFHFNYYQYAYEFAFSHYWKSLEVSQFANKKLLEDFLEISTEPDFAIIPNEYL